MQTNGERRQLVQVPFYGAVMEATQDDRGIWVSMRRVCDSLGLDISSQLKKLMPELGHLTDAALLEHWTACVLLECALCLDYPIQEQTARRAQIATQAADEELLRRGLQRPDWIHAEAIG